MREERIMLSNMSSSLIPKQICDILFCYETGCLYATQHSIHSCFHSVEVLRSYIMCVYKYKHLKVTLKETGLCTYF